jgi:membrane fusion protein (multidrug efflux system)
MQIKEMLNRGVLRQYSFAAVVVALIATMTGVILLKDLVGLAFAGGHGQQASGGGKGGNGGPGQGGGSQGKSANGQGDAGAGKGAGSQSAERKGAGAGGGQGGGGAPLVDVAVIAPAQFYDAVQALGTAQARESITVTSKVSDVIRKIRFDSGDRVKKGQVLVELANVEQQADLNNARAQLQVDKSAFARYNELYQKGFAPKAKVEEAQAAQNRSQAQVEGMLSRISDRTIRAPFDGVVGLRNASPGLLATPGTAIATLDDTSVIKLDFDVPEAQLAKMKKNVPLIAKAAAFPGVEFAGRIDQVDSRVNPQTRTVRVRALLPNQTGRLKPGMLMTVEVRSGGISALAAPEVALIDEGDAVYVYRVVSKGQMANVEKVKIVAGRRMNGNVEILGGVDSGDKIIVNGMLRVRPGQPVRVNAGDDQSGASAAGGARTRGRI